MAWPEVAEPFLEGIALNEYRKKVYELLFCERDCFEQLKKEME